LKRRSVELISIKPSGVRSIQPGLLSLRAGAFSDKSAYLPDNK
jgi:hypothetical protein